MEYYVHAQMRHYAPAALLPVLWWWCAAPTGLLRAFFKRWRRKKVRVTVLFLDYEKMFHTQKSIQCTVYSIHMFIDVV